MNDEEFGTTAEYLRAFETVRAEGMADNHLALLRAHHSAPRHTTTWAQLAAAIGYANGNAVNLQYGTFAGRVAHAMGITAIPNGFWLDVLAGWAISIAWVTLLTLMLHHKLFLSSLKA